MGIAILWDRPQGDLKEPLGIFLRFIDVFWERFLGSWHLGDLIAYTIEFVSGFA